ncbi:MAG TPA: S16 family serine protease [Enhygromyxa sp.]|nr:S16 family serine protease [Enhygromyxa sp.]
MDAKLIGLINDVLLPGETRSFRAPVLDGATLHALQTEPPEQLAALCVTARGELPTMVLARWATLAQVLRVDQDGVTLRGLARARILSAFGDVAPYSAVLEMEVEQDQGALGELRQSIREAHRLLAALEGGADPGHAGWVEALRDAIATLLRAVSDPATARELVALPLPEALRKRAQDLAVAQVAHEAGCELEAALAKIAADPQLDVVQRRQLWSQLVALQRRLDLFEPEVADEDHEELPHLQRRLQQAGLPKSARLVAKRGLRLLRTMTTSNHDYSVRLGHLDFIARLPWHPDPPVTLDLAELERHLEAGHAGLAEPKRRILEYFAVRSLGGKSTGTVLCLAGPPGVGKTSLAVAIARALGRPLARVALGGVHDESEIRGHRLSFVAAAPGRILRGIADAGSASCVMLLDEIDKVGTERGRSPAAALLEVLDPHQNAHFRDNYLGVPFDLSDVLFICTANDVSKISGPLRDRLEILELEGYTTREKVDIAMRHLIGPAARDCGLPSADLLGPEVVEQVVEGYTREAGVRELTRKITALFRGRALELAQRGPSSSDAAPAVPIDVAELTRRLGPPRFRERARAQQLPIGVATGLSVNAVGGSTMFVEVGRMPGRGELRLTGRLGEVLRESAQAVLAHLRLEAQRLGIEDRALRGDWHVHLPEAATSKDGPSAGVALFAAMLSVLRQTSLPADVAMTGEATLMGDVLAIGGVRAKLLAAERAGMRLVLVPRDNLADVPDDVRVEVLGVSTLAEVAQALGLGSASGREVVDREALSSERGGADA